MSNTDTKPVTLDAEGDTSEELAKLTNFDVSNDGEPVEFIENITDPVLRNIRRAQHAVPALLAYVESLGDDSRHEPLTQTVQDLLSDTMHLCDLFKEDPEGMVDTFEFLVDSAEVRYMEECAGEG